MKLGLLLLLLLTHSVQAQICQTNTQYIRSVLSPEPTLQFSANPSWITSQYTSGQQLNSSATGYSIPLDAISDSVWMEFATRTPTPMLQHLQLIMIRDINGVTRFLISYLDGNILIYAGCNFECKYPGSGMGWYECTQNMIQKIPYTQDTNWHFWKIQFVRGNPSLIYVWMDGKRIYTNTSFSMVADAYMMTAVGVGYYVAGSMDISQPYIEWKNIRTKIFRPMW